MFLRWCSRTQRAASLLLWILMTILPTHAQESTSFLEVTIDNPAPYVGQPVLYTLRFYDADPEQQKQYLAPAFNGFGQQSTAEIPPSVAQINGQQYTVYTLETLLFPIRSGEQIIDPYRVVYQDSGQVLTAEAVTLMVQSLPDDAPQSFTNAIGQYDVTAFLSAAIAQPGEALTYTLNITGTGNTQNITVSNPDFSSSWQVFPGEVRYEESTRNFGTKTFMWSIIPQQPGTLILPPLEFSYFDPQSSSYVTKTTGDFQVAVTGDVQSSAASVVETDIPENPSLILPLRENFTLDAVPNPAPGFWLLWLVAPIFAGISWFLTRSDNTETPASSRRRAGSALQSAIRDLKKLEGELPEAIFGAIPPIILTYLQRKTGKNITPENISEQISYLPEKVQKRVLYCLETAESARYAPVTTADAQQLLRQVATTLKQIERIGML